MATLVIDIHTAFLSDTIVISVSIGSGSGAASAVAVAAYHSSIVLGEAPKSDPKLAYRGCIAYGDFEVQLPFVLGAGGGRGGRAPRASRGRLRVARAERAPGLDGS